MGGLLIGGFIKLKPVNTPNQDALNDFVAVVANFMASFTGLY
jgi:hypothetical protein